MEKIASKILNNPMYQKIDKVAKTLGFLLTYAGRNGDKITIITEPTEKYLPKINVEDSVLKIDLKVSDSIGVEEYEKVIEASKRGLKFAKALQIGLDHGAFNKLADSSED